MIRISLGSTEEKKALNRLRLIKKSCIGERAHYVLLADEGKSVEDIAAHLSRNRHTVRLWLKRYLRDGIAGLSSRNNPGRPAKKAPVIESQLQELLSKSPQEYGYQEAGWQINILRDWFAKQGLYACTNTLVKALNKLDFVYKRFSKKLLRFQLQRNKQASAYLNPTKNQKLKWWKMTHWKPNAAKTGIVFCIKLSSWILFGV